MLDSISGVKTQASAPEASAQTPAKIHEAARQFEALLLAQILKSMKDAEGGWLGTGEDQSSSSAMEYGQEMFAQQLSASGGLGLATLIIKGLKSGDGH